MNPPSHCPSCRQPMVQKMFARQLYGEVELDFCFACQGIWFDNFESVQITPGSIIELFKLIHQHRDEPRLPLSEPLHCPRCNERLLHGLDVAKHGGQFNYHRCLQKHGRFTTFAQFMIEKGFVRQLTVAEIDELASRVGIVRCNGCGAPIDIRKEHACSHCRAPISILDPQAVEQALARYQQADSKLSAPPDYELLADAIVIRERERSRQLREKQKNGDSFDGAEIVDLVSAGVELVSNLFRR
ncbi:zf-TFIIB domain-containing protein [Azonexus sp. IMCC34842]|uniref:zf-TFIIB domain-containing protein n=1 Tax=Azonexus sp. IMCC34842 TaxID=3420950 RepID=UPI003D13CF78